MRTTPWWTPVLSLSERAQVLARSLVPDGAVLLGADWNGHSGYVALVVERNVHDPFFPHTAIQSHPLRGEAAAALFDAVRDQRPVSCVMAAK